LKLVCPIILSAVVAIDPLIDRIAAQFFHNKNHPLTLHRYSEHE
jgi:hypothetical protein